MEFSPYSQLTPGRLLAFGLAALFSCLAVIGTANAGATVDQPTAVSASTNRPICRHGYHLDGSQSRGFLCSSRHHGFTYPGCQAGYQLREASNRRHRPGRKLCVLIRRAPTAPVETPLTAANICGFNPGLGVMHSGANAVYWDINQDGEPDFGASNIEGDSKVDAAWILNGRVLTWMAFCYPHESGWINVPQYERERREPLALTPTAWQQLSEILAFEGSLAHPWVSGEPSVGAVWLNTGQCSAAYQYCERVS